MTKNTIHDPARTGADETQRQLSLDVSSPMQDEERSPDCSVKSGTQADRGPLFFPSNREDILLHLSSLAISIDFPAGVGIVPVRDGTPALLPDGLRAEEASILQGGRAEKFPVLVELRKSVRDGQAVIGVGEVAALHFRNQSEADDFRFRPVDEMNPEEITYCVQPSLFGLPGSPRLEGRQQEGVGIQGQGHFADRIAGGVCSLLELGDGEAKCWPDIADLLCQPLVAGPLNEITFKKVLETGAAQLTNNGQADAVVRAYIAHAAGASRSALVVKVGANLTEGAAGGDEIKTAERWIATANAVLQNQVRLDGDLLSDNGSVPLRAALLAAVVDDVRALIAFMHGPKPAGRKVTAAAAFLIGLRMGVTDMPWATKRAHLNILSSLVVVLRGGGATARKVVGRAFQIEPEEIPSGAVLHLLWKEHEVASWKLGDTERRHDLTIAQQDQSAGQLESAAEGPSPDVHFAEVGTASSVTSNMDSGNGDCIVSYEGRVIEFLQPEPTGGYGVTMRCRLTATDRLRKPKEILEGACSQGLLWRVGVSAEGTAALYADIPNWPSDAMLRELERTLEYALGMYLVKKKSPARPTTARGRVARRQEI